MRAEIWSPDGIEAAATGALYEELEKRRTQTVTKLEEAK
jgi:hypothetical protein